jgi:hypothetical protein
VLAPINAVHLLRFLKLVMSGWDTVEAVRILGSSTLVAIHDAHRPIPLLVGVRSSGADTETAA